MKVYFDHAATTPIDPEVAKIMIEVINDCSGNPSSIHGEGRKARARIEQARKTMANIINSSIGEVFFTSSATEANNTILRNCVKSHGIKHIISSPIEHPCVKNTIEDIENEEEVTVHWVDIHENGKILTKDIQSILESIEGNTLISIMYGNNEIGTINDIAAISKMAKEYGAKVHTDAVQMFGKYPIDVQELGVDYLTTTGHKMNGPKGVGMMYIKNDSVFNPYITGGSQERNMRAGTENIYGIVGLAKSAELAVENRTERVEYIRSLNSYFRQEIRRICPDVSFNGNFENGMCHICSVNFPNNQKNELLLFNLDIKGICASSGSACSSGSQKGSHVIDALNLTNNPITMRFSFSHINTKEEIDYTISTLDEILEKESVYA